MKTECNKKCQLNENKTGCKSCGRTIQEITERGKNYISKKGKVK